MRKKILIKVINLNSDISIIINDCQYFWSKDLSNLLLSKRFFDNKIMKIML